MEEILRVFLANIPQSQAKLPFSDVLDLVGIDHANRTEQALELRALCSHLGWTAVPGAIYDLERVKIPKAPLWAARVKPHLEGWDGQLQSLVASLVPQTPHADTPEALPLISSALKYLGWERASETTWRESGALFRWLACQPANAALTYGDILYIVGKKNNASTRAEIAEILRQHGWESYRAASGMRWRKAS